MTRSLLVASQVVVSQLAIVSTFANADTPHAGVRALHKFGRSHAYLKLEQAGRQDDAASDALKVMHITDSHISVNDDDPPRTTRMFRAFEHTTDRFSHTRTTSSAEFVKLLKLACDEQVDLIALGGDIVNFPSESTVAWVLQQLEGPGCGTPFVYTAGNHDWHKEGGALEHRYDAQRRKELTSTLWPLFNHSAAEVHSGGLFGRAHVKGVDVLFLDNSNHQIDEDQLAFARQQLARSGPPVLLLLHIPLALPGEDLQPRDSCGHPGWGASADTLWQTEGRPRWPEKGNVPSTSGFIDLVQAQAAPLGRIVAVIAGHVHRDFTIGLSRPSVVTHPTSLLCNRHQLGCSIRPSPAAEQQADRGSQRGRGKFWTPTSRALGVSVVANTATGTETHSEAEGALQYISLDAAEGGYRLLRIERGTV